MPSAPCEKVIYDLELAPVDGAITFGAGRPQIGKLAEGLGCPIVEISQDPCDVPVTRVAQDGVAQGRLAAASLLERGYRRFAFWHTLPAPIAQERIEGVRESVLEAGGDFALLDWEAARRRGRARSERPTEWLIARLQALTPPMALFAVNDMFGIYLVEACLAAGMSIPEDVAVASFDNEEIACENAIVPLSSVDVDLEHLGYRAAEVLEELMNGGPPPDEPVLVPPRRFVARYSTDMVAVDHPQVARGVRFILSHYTHTMLTVGSIADATSMSRRGLNEAFQRHLGRSISAELARVRLHHARHMLETTSASATAVARGCGFSGLKHLRRALRRATGMTPRAYRSRSSVNGGD